jgi:sterol desaturase/sphingolipid hydroxylase (fatty acid hydroxylase superfamily)
VADGEHDLRGLREGPASRRGAEPPRALARRAAWPAVVVAVTLSFAWAFAHAPRGAAVVGVPVAFIGVLLALEAWLPARPGASPWRDPQIGNDVGHAIVGQGLAGPLGEVLFLGAAGALAGEVAAQRGAPPWPTGWPFAAQALAAVFLADGLEYARHRLLHGVGWLWPVHALHHAVDRLHVGKASRSHLLDMLGRSLAVYAPLVALGVPADVLAWYPAAVTVFGPIAHANVDVRVPRWLHRLVLTPQVHRIHHARALELSCSNYANVFPLWDLVFGTFTHPDAHPAPEFGIEPDPMPRGFTDQLLAPLRWRALGRAPREALDPATPSPRATRRAQRASRR